MLKDLKLARFDLKRMTDADWPWRLSQALFVYFNNGVLAYVGKAEGGQTVGDLWEIHEVDSHPVPRMIRKGLGGQVNLAVFAGPLSRPVDGMTTSEVLNQAQLSLVQRFDPPGNRPTTDRGRDEARAARIRADFVIHITGWPLSPDGVFKG